MVLPEIGPEEPVILLMKVRSPGSAKHLNKICDRTVAIFEVVKMSDVATFEFQTDIDLESIRQKISTYWTGKGRRVDVYTWEPDRTFCVLECFLGESEERIMLYQTAKCLLELARDNRVYYYRSIDFVGFYNPENYEDSDEIANYQSQPVPINVADLLLNSYHLQCQHA